MKLKNKKNLQKKEIIGINMKSILYKHNNNHMKISSIISIFIIIILICLFENRVLALCQDNIGPTVENLHNMSDLQFDSWLASASDIGHQININSIRTKVPYLASIEKFTRFLARTDLINDQYKLVSISAKILTDTQALILNQNLSKFYFMQISMNVENQQMPVEMYLDTLSHIVSDFNKDYLAVHGFKSTFINRNFNIDLITNQNLAQLDLYHNSIKNNIFELRQHSMSIDFNNLYGGGSDSE